MPCTHRLLDRGISHVEFRAEHLDAILEDEGARVADVAGAAFDDEDAFVGEVGGEAACDYAAGCAASDDEVVEGAGWEGV